MNRNNDDEIPQSQNHSIWEKVSGFLESSESGFDRYSLTDADKKRILRERAVEFAYEAEDYDSVVKCIEVLEFFLAHERYSIDSKFIKEVYPFKEVTEIPFTPPFILGIINIRGQIYSVMDLKKLFNLPDKQITENNKVIIVHNSLMEFGILADTITGVSQIPVSEIQPPPTTLTGIYGEYLQGVTSERLIILNMEKMLSDKKIIINDEI